MQLPSWPGFKPQDANLGRMGYSVVPTAVAAPALWPGTDMLYTDPRDTHPRLWTVHLNAMKFVAGTLVGGGSPGLDNRVDVFPQYVAEVTFGCEGGNEIARVDWYARGNTFQLMGASVKMSVRPTFAQTTNLLPQLSAFMVPAERTAHEFVQSPTFTNFVPAVAAGAFVFVNAPARAVGFRLQLPTVTVVNQWAMTQVAGNGVPTPIEDDGSTPQIFGNTPDNLAGNKAAFFPLGALTQALRLQNNAAIPQDVYVQWVLDLG